MEPPSIPDVLADRPVIIFGKWRGRPQGNISLRGIAGDGSFMKEVDVGKIKPLKTNSALRYLWARHRIAILSDYNKLRPQDERVGEVTNLGLTYNLLTAYTSFVAIDTLVRLKDGKAVTVKQPLPLPQGVSDYAVGNRILTQKGFGMTAAPSTMAYKGIIREEGLEHKKEDGLDLKPLITTPALEKMPIKLGTIAVTEGLSKESIQRVMEEHLNSINQCNKYALWKQSSQRVELKFRLVIDLKGRVTGVKVNTSQENRKELERCIVEKLKKLCFPTPEGGKNVVVTITLILK